MYSAELYKCLYVTYLFMCCIFFHCPTAVSTSNLKMQPVLGKRHNHLGKHSVNTAGYQFHVWLAVKVKIGNNRRQILSMYTLRQKHFMGSALEEVDRWLWKGRRRASV